ncbi:uncharacterized protein LOC131065478 [Cryptomeria japonica]|uniref:uncharacterized protein LOC131065478 n=1 Tax=Cryptomeria japonica TaxID=3369 RepID=UPI0027D9FBFF|nr:uncharacterized protein LOC131065478 [Cryptomeria japonica]
MGMSGVGVVFRDHGGNLVKFGAQRIKQGTNNEVEAYPALLAIRCAWKMGVKELYLEEDSLIIIQAIKNGKIKAWNLQKNLSLILADLNSFEDVVVSHVRREGNKVADKLSKWAMSFNQEEDSRFEFFDGVAWWTDRGYIHLPDVEVAEGSLWAGREP